MDIIQLERVSSCRGYLFWLTVNNVLVIRGRTIDCIPTSFLNPLNIGQACNLLASFKYDRYLLTRFLVPPLHAIRALMFDGQAKLFTVAYTVQVWFDKLGWHFNIGDLMLLIGILYSAEEPNNQARWGSRHTNTSEPAPRAVFGCWTSKSEHRRFFYAFSITALDLNS